jgi:hypothetical protein
MNSASKAFGEGAANFEISSEPITALQVFEHVIFRHGLAVLFVVVAVAISSSSNILMLAIRSPLLFPAAIATCLNEQVILDDLNL